MKYNITLNQPKMIEHSLNVSQWCILDILSVAPTWCEIVNFNNSSYFWVARQKISEELEAFDFKSDTIFRYLKQLKELGFIDYEKEGKKDLIRLTILGKSLFTMSEKNPNDYIGKKSESNTEKNPTYNNTNLNNYTDINYDDFLSSWNRFASSNNKSKIAKLTDSRKKKILARSKEVKKFYELFNICLEKSSNSTFLKNSSFFGFDWLVENDTNIVKVFEDKYKDKETNYAY